MVVITLSQTELNFWLDLSVKKNPFPGPPTCVPGFEYVP